MKCIIKALPSQESGGTCAPLLLSAAWNEMVVKRRFVQIRLLPIDGVMMHHSDN